MKGYAKKLKNPRVMGKLVMVKKRGDLFSVLYSPVVGLRQGE